jgi:hypothetical protein
MRRFLGLTSFLAMIFALEVHVQAAPIRVVLLGIGASDSDAAGEAPRLAEDAVRQMLSSHFQLMAGAAYKAKAQELGATGASPEEVSKVCHAMGVDALLAGILATEQDTWELRLVLRRCDDGSVVQKYSYPLSSPEVDYNTLKQVETDLVSGIDSVGPVLSAQGGAAAGTPTPTEPPPTQTGGESETPPANGGTSTTSGGGGGPPEGALTSPDDEMPPDLASENPLEEEAAQSDDTGAESAGPETSGTAGTVTRTPTGEPQLAQVSAGLSVGARDFSFRTPQPKQYFRGQPTSGIYGEASLFPLAGRVDNHLLAGFGLFGYLDYVPNYTTDIRGTGTQLGTFEQTWSAALAFRTTVGQSDLPPVVRASFGYGDREFIISQQAGVSIPSVEYRFLEARVGCLLPLVGGLLGVSADVGLVPVVGVNLGAQPTAYGTPSGGLGYEGTLGTEVRITRHIRVRADLRFVRLPSSYTAVGPATDTHIDGDLLGTFLF